MNWKIYIDGKDIRETYGCKFLSGWMSAIFKPAPMKEYISNRSKAEDGKTVLRSYAKVDERNFEIPVGIWAESFAEYRQKIDTLLGDLRSSALHILKAECEGTEYIFKVSFVSSEEYIDYNGRWGKLFIKFNEPNPADRSI